MRKIARFDLNLRTLTKTFIYSDFFDEVGKKLGQERKCYMMKWRPIKPRTGHACMSVTTTHPMGLVSATIVHKTVGGL